MAYTCNDIVGLAMGRLRLKRAGDTPTGTEAADGMIALQSLYDTWVADGLFGRLNDTIPSSDYTAFEQDRVINDGNYNITLPLTIVPSIPSSTYTPIWPDERTWNFLYTSLPRPPRDLSMIEVVANNATTRSIYDDHQRQWISIGSLALTDNAPLANRGAMGLASCLAVLWAPDFGVEPSPAVLKSATEYKWGLSSRYDSQRVAGRQDYF